MRFDDILNDDETVGEINAKAAAKQAEIDDVKGIQLVGHINDKKFFVDKKYSAYVCKFRMYCR